MWKMHEIREMMKLFEESSLQEMEIEIGGSDNKISLKKQKELTMSDEYKKGEFNEPAAVAVAMKAVAAPSKNKIAKTINQPVSEENKTTQGEVKNQAVANDASIYKITSPMVGTFYRAPAEDADSFVEIGDKVEKSTIVCILEAMKLFNEIEAEVSGEIIEILVQDGQLVEYDQPLFLVKTE